MTTYTLNNGIKIPAIGFGTWQIEDGEPAYNAVAEALNAGYIHIDTAAVYGNEKSVGKAIQDSGIDRDDLFITTKLWNADRGYENTLTAFEKSLALLNLTYVDLYLIHWPANEAQFENWAEINADTWRAFEKLYVDGRVKAIGLSNFPKKYVETLLKTVQIKPAVNQLEFHPGYLQEETVSYCKENNILVQAWSPLGSGRILDNEVLLSLAKKYNVSVGQICIKFALQEGINPLPKSTNPINIKANLDLSNFELTAEDIASIKNMGDLGFSGLNPAEVPF